LSWRRSCLHTRVSPHLRTCACVLACVLACVHSCVRTWMHEGVESKVLCTHLKYMRACVRACEQSKVPCQHTQHMHVHSASPTSTHRLCPCAFPPLIPPSLSQVKLERSAERCSNHGDARAAPTADRGGAHTTSQASSRNGDRPVSGGREAGAVHGRREEAPEEGVGLEPCVKKAKVSAPPEESTPTEREAGRERGRGPDSLSLQQDAVHSAHKAHEDAKEGAKRVAQVSMPARSRTAAACKLAAG
jgi:hypothetical protein